MWMWCWEIFKVFVVVSDNCEKNQLRSILSYRLFFFCILKRLFFVRFWLWAALPGGNSAGIRVRRSCLRRGGSYPARTGQSRRICLTLKLSLLWCEDSPTVALATTPHHNAQSMRLCLQCIEELNTDGYRCSRDWIFFFFNVHCIFCLQLPAVPRAKTDSLPSDNKQ